MARVNPSSMKRIHFPKDHLGIIKVTFLKEVQRRIQSVEPIFKGGFKRTYFLQASFGMVEVMQKGIDLFAILRNTVPPSF